ncbi:MAG: M48 family metallopeptidase [Candidatus Nanopelagicales bacterium]
MSVELLFSVLIFIVIFGFLADTWLDILNFRHSQAQAWNPDLYTEDQHEKSLAYQRANFKFGLLSSTLSIFVTLLALGFGLFGLLDSILRDFTDNSILLALLFFGTYGLITNIVSLPFSIYSTFGIEKRFGFNRTSLSTFVTDKIKGLLIGVLLGGSLLSLLVLLSDILGSNFWFAAWLVIMAVTLFLFAFNTSLLVPLFNKLTRLEDGELKDAITDYCKSQGYEIGRLFVMDGSKRSSKANAFFSGIGRSKTIVLFDTLIEKLTIDEVVAVLAHEVGHYKRKHTLAMFIFSAVQMFIFTFLFGLMLNRDEFSEVLGAEPSFHIAAITFFILFSPLSMLLSWLLNTFSRRNEFDADQFATSTYKSHVMRTALEKISTDALTNLNPHPWYVKVHYSHPPLIERVKALR